MRLRTTTHRKPARGGTAFAPVVGALVLALLQPAAPALAAVPADGTPDTAPPQVFSAWSATDVDATGGPVAVKLLAGDDVGIDGGFDVWFTNGNAESPHARATSVGGDARAGDWRATATLPAGVGTWHLHTGPVRDAAGNTAPAKDWGDDVATTVREGVPHPPAHLAAAPGGGHVLRLSWPAADDGGVPITGYRVVNARYETLAELGPDARSYDVDLDGDPTPLADGTFRVVSVNSAFSSTASALSARTPVTGAVPDAPAAPTAEAGFRSGLVRVPEPADRLLAAVTEVDVTAQPGGATCRVDVGGCYLEGLTPGRTYSVTATSRNALGTSLPSPAVALTPWVAPTAPTGVAVELLDGVTARVTWNASTVRAGGAPATYTVRTVPASSVCTTDALHCSITGLTPGVTYRFVVVPNGDREADGAPSKSVSATAYGVPAAPGRVTLTRGTDSVKLIWSAAASRGRPITGYTVTLAPDEGEARVLHLGPSARSAVFRHVTPVVLWTATVSATNAVGTSADGGGVVFALPDRTLKPAKPRPPVVRALGARSVSLRWVEGPRYGSTAVDRYQVVVRRGIRVVATSTTRSLASRITGLARGTAYAVTLRAHNGAGWSAVSGKVVFRTRR